MSALDILGRAKAIIKSDRAIKNKLFNTKIFKEAPLLKNNFRFSVLETCNEAFLLEKNTILDSTRNTSRTSKYKKFGFKNSISIIQTALLSLMNAQNETKFPL